MRGIQMESGLSFRQFFLAAVQKRGWDMGVFIDTRS
jgi:hypothetical protein